MQKQKSTKKEKCPKCTKEDVHNDASWYTRDVVPMIGANFARLSSIDTDTVVITGKETRINAAGYYSVALTPPLDSSNSGFRKAAELYAEIREANSGAANYTPQDLYAYAMNVITLRSLCIHAAKVMQAARASGPLYKESPYIFTAVCGIKSNFSLVSGYASTYNRLSLVFKDIEALPIPPLAIMDRNEFLLGNMFQDSETTRPALFTFVPDQYITLAVNGTTFDTTINTLASADITSIFTAINQLYWNITTNQVNAIIRGDMIKAFGTAAMRRDLVARLGMPLPIGYSKDVADQIMNATVIGNGNIDNAYILSGEAYVSSAYNATQSWGNIELGAATTRRPINFHGVEAPRDGNLLAITRLLLQADVDGSTVYIRSGSGVVLLDFKYITDVTTTSLTVASVGSLLDATHSTVQSTATDAYQKLGWLYSVIEGLPLIVWKNGGPDGASFMFNIDNFASITGDEVDELNLLANRSLMAAHLPRTDSGRIDRTG